jgi:DNA-binding NarL/FixJ family response regulator
MSIPAAPTRHLAEAEGHQVSAPGRTVQTHLAHVFARLDISARAQLAAEVTRRRPV